jgi:hypothetical protein
MASFGKYHHHPRGPTSRRMITAYSIVDNELRVLVYDTGRYALPSGQHTLFAVPGQAQVELLTVDAADYFGNTMPALIGQVPKRFTVRQNHPNPFNLATTISFDLPERMSWSLIVYNIVGQKVRTYSGESDAGTIQVVWDGTDDNGHVVSTGVYLYEVIACEYSATRKMLVLK